jgi:hypothetical protein
MRPIHAGAVLLAGLVLPLEAALAQAPPGPDNLVLTCTGPFAADTTPAKIAAVFGRSNVVSENLHVGEGETEPGTVIYPKDPARRVEIFWLDAKKKARLSTVQVREETSRWRMPGGIGHGTTLAALETANGKPLELLGFSWDFGGTVRDWRGGALASIGGDPKCRMSATFEPAPNLPDKIGNAVMGDRAFRSDNRSMRAAKPTLTWIGLNVVQPD